VTINRTIRVTVVGDSALRVELGEAIDETIVGAVQLAHGALVAADLAGIVEVVPTYAALTAYYNPALVAAAGAPVDDLAGWLTERIRNVVDQGTTADTRRGDTIEVPVCYGGEFGPDLSDVAGHAGLSPDEVVRRHSQATYRVAMLGFAPGFPYLIGLPQELAAPRLQTPRLRVPAGSVGIAGRQTGIYPRTTPGGWRLIGRTPLRLFDAEADRPALLQPGDTVRFRAVSAEVFETQTVVGQAFRPGGSSSTPAMTVITPGLMTSVMDLGRPGYQYLGVPVGGALDRFTARIANAVVGNADEAALLEMTQTGPTLRFDRPALVAWYGADMGATVGADRLPVHRAVRVAAGEQIESGPARGGVRAWLAVAGGLDVPPVLGSRSTDSASAFGGLQGRRLQSGDRLDALEPGPWARAEMTGVRRSSPWFVHPEGLCPPAAFGVVRAMTGPEWDWFTAESQQAFFTSVWHVTKDADRMGVRLEGPALMRRDTKEMISTAAPEGLVQVPAGGQPIVLLAGRQTVGGYPGIASIASVDWGVLAQVVPGDTIRFEAISIEAAHALMLSREEAFAQLRAGLNRIGR
jgi:KipI family sensor histidine kinase inhibitor